MGAISATAGPGMQSITPFVIGMIAVCADQSCLPQSPADALYDAFPQARAS